VIAAAGDIVCDPIDANFNGGLGTANACAQMRTSDLLVASGFDAVLTLGDNQYDAGSLTNFNTAYEPSWGRAKAITNPAIGNHEGTSSGSGRGYCSYFGGAAHCNANGSQDGAAYYSFDVGTWHLIVLNSNCTVAGGCGAGSPEEQWLRADLAAHGNQCTLAYWHHPRWSSGNHGSNSSYDAFWRDLYNAGADVVLNGHDHDYERFAPQNPDGAADAAKGIREFVVGTGGKNHYGFATVAANSEIRNADTFGVLKLTLHAAGYEWQFVPEASRTFTDAGSSSCH